ncbi:MAG: hypothetical protein E7598_02355 [Ruminococcaceae bacterium]|nr:hypothetical protein [Oscillospiraceae bacterium]
MKKVACSLFALVLLFIMALCLSATENSVTYVSDSGSDFNDGLSDKSPFKTLAAAYDYVSKGGTVVVCGPLTLNGEALKFPKSTGNVKITSNYGGIDYSKTNNAVLNLGGYTYLNGDTEFEDIRIHDSSTFYFNQLVCQGNNLTVGNNVTCTRATGEYITILGGQYINSKSMTAESVSFYDYTITINSGLWFMVNGSNKRTSNESAMGATGGVKIIINGGSFTGKAANQADAMISAGGYASQDGDYYIEINGGVFNTPIIAIARPGNNSGRYTAYYEGDVHIRITGGEFRGAKVATVQSEAASYIGGNYSLEITGGTFTALESVSATRVRGTSACLVTTDANSKVRGFDVEGDIKVNEKVDNIPNLAAGDGVVFVGNSDGNGKNARTPVKSLETAASILGENGGTIVVCSPLRVKNADLPKTEGKITITSVYGGNDFREICGAEIELTGIISLGGETVFENVDFESRSLAAYIFCRGNKTVFGDGINCRIHMDGGVTEHIGIFTGDRLVTTSANALGKTFSNITVNSGEWRFLRAGNERAHGGVNTLRTVSGNSIININGGKFHEDVCVTGKNSHDGDITLNISGGTFLCSLYGMATPANVDNDMSVVNGSITFNISGGEFHGDIAPVQNKEKNTFNGKFVLNITGGDFRAVGTVEGTEKVLGSNSSSLETTVDFSSECEGTIAYKNPVIGYGADPSVYYRDGWYYYVRPSTVGSKPCIQISRAVNISDIGNTTAKTVYIADENIKSIWAPQVYCFEGEWYIYFSGAPATSTSAARSPYVLKADSNDPLGSYTALGTMQNMDNGIYSWLSPRIFEYNDTRYYISSVFVNAEDNTSSRHKQTLVICELSSPVSFKGNVNTIATPDKSWEGYDIIEGPFPVYANDGTLYIAYAANYADGDDYCTGLLKLVGEDLCNIESWEKQPRPMQHRDADNLVFAPGATVFVNLPVGEDVYAIYHAKLHANNRYNRSIFVQKLEYKDGVPYLGSPPVIETEFLMAANPMPVENRIVGFEKGNAFEKTREYKGQFTDVTEKEWFYDYVKTAFEYSLANGTSAVKFSPGNKFTVAQALTAAANIHVAYNGKEYKFETSEAWYTPYVDYCIKNGIILDNQFTDYNRNITRGEMAIVFANILPESEYTEVRNGSNPDVTSDLACFYAVRKLYNAGIVGGDAGSGNYRPDDEIVRSEACVIFTRIAAKEYRAK